jgi:hypothetical protein
MPTGLKVLYDRKGNIVDTEHICSYTLVIEEIIHKHSATRMTRIATKVMCPKCFAVATI